VSLNTISSFQLLLDRLGSDPAAAADKYEELRSKLVHLFLWKGCPESEADTLADIVFDRVALKLAGGEQIENVGGFACGVMRFVWLEYCRKHKEEAVGDDLPEVAVGPDLSAIEEPDRRVACLRSCLAETVHDAGDRELIIGYYDAGTGETNKEIRKRLAEKFGLTAGTLKVRVCRLRMRLERCINECIGRVTHQKTSGTNKQEER
jgi:DNA-directed RNA polymerase specialized sigma24 family protein